MKKQNRFRPIKSLKSEDNYSSIVSRAGQVMTIIVSLSMLSLIASMLVSENLSGDASQINQAGALRMQATRISRTKLIDQLETSQQSQEKLQQEMSEFEHRLEKLLVGGLTSARKSEEVDLRYRKVLSFWQQLKGNRLEWSIENFDKFVRQIDDLVVSIQLESEHKLDILRLIQGGSLFALLTVSAIVLLKLNRLIVTPLKQLVQVASEIGKGNFDLKAEYNSDNELGVLANTINDMSAQLKLTYRDFETRVAEKTKQLVDTNNSLQLLYQVANKLASSDYQLDDKAIIQDIQPLLGCGKVFIERTPASTIRPIAFSKASRQLPVCINRFEFPLEKQTQQFGVLIWETPRDHVAQEWQHKLLKAMADLLATAIQLEQKRNTEDRLLIVEERAVIARELHDSLAQSLSYLKVQLTLLTRKLQKEVSKEEVNLTIEDIKSGINSAYRQLRELLTTFRLQLDDPALNTALQGTISEFSSKCGHPVKLDFRLPADFLSANQEIHVLQIIREALSNVQRHAQATEAGVSVSARDNRVKVEIWDDGVGFDPVQKRQDHFGMGIMEERAKSLGTLIEITSPKGGGTSVALQFESQNKYRRFDS